MMRKTQAVMALVLCQAASLAAHDMYLKPDGFVVGPNADHAIALYNGTFDKSENTIDRDRMIDVRIVGPEDEVSHPEESAWSESDNVTWLASRTGEPGTYVIGVSTRGRALELTAEEFNEYLEHDGVVDMLEKRRAEGTLGESSNELYSKHVKAIFQVGEARTGSWARALGYPIEIVPRSNPYELARGDRFEFQVLRDGEPVANGLVYASHAGFHGHTPEGGHSEAVRVRTDTGGVAGFELSTAGQWYVRLIHMVETDRDGLTHESNWATLTFEVAE